MLEQMGGRKFLMAVLCMAAGVAIELKAENGLSVNMLGLLTAIYATFSATNTIITNKQLKIEASEGGAEVPSPVVEQPEAAAVAPNNELQELRTQLVPIVNLIGQELVSIKDAQKAQMEATGAIQQTVSNIQKAISALLSLRS